MDPLEARRLLRQRPFQPFRVTLKDGHTYEIRYPEINMVHRSTFLIGIPKQDSPFPVYEYLIRVPWEDIKGHEFLQAASSTSATS